METTSNSNNSTLAVFNHLKTLFKSATVKNEVIWINSSCTNFETQHFNFEWFEYTKNEHRQMFRFKSHDSLDITGVLKTFNIVIPTNDRSKTPLSVLIGSDIIVDFDEERFLSHALIKMVQSFEGWDDEVLEMVMNNNHLSHHKKLIHFQTIFEYQELGVEEMIRLYTMYNSVTFMYDYKF